MTESFSCGIEGCDYEGETPEGLRSHVAASTDEEHQRARNQRAWEGWYPAAYGATDAGSSAPTADQAPSEGATEGGKPPDDADSDDLIDEGASTPSETSSEGGTEGVSDASSGRDEYAEQWSEGDDLPSEGVESKDGGDSDDPDEERGATPSEGGSKGGRRRLVTLAAPLLGLLLLLFRGDRDDQPEPSATEELEDADQSETNDAEFSTIER
ncbi:hypothetical protein [Halorarius litoreus]|uniref:hypothetical protein n=1 Tax=Halorarius litoreus TaxID=2962676 RepID=UPI0020CDC9E9|nr:hypothetical protein [Halorarius litoreus]